MVQTFDDDLFEDFEDVSDSDSLNNHNTFNASLTENEIDDFKKSEEYKKYSATVDNENIKINRQGKTVQEIFGLRNLKESVNLSFNSFEHTDLDIDFLNDIVDNSPVMQETLEGGSDILPTFEYLYQDIFLSLHKYSVKLLPESEMHMSTIINRKFAECYLNTPEYIKLRQTCRMDQFNAALGTEILSNKLLPIIKQVMDKIKDVEETKKKMKELMKKEQEMDDLIEEREDLDDILQMMQDNGNTGGMADIQAEIDSNALAQQQAQQLANQLAKEMDDLIEQDDIGNEIVQRAGKVFDETSTEIAEISNLVNAWGFGEGEKSRVSYQNKKTAIESIRKSTKLKKLTDLIGKFKESAITEQKKKTKNGAVEISSVTLGNKIEDVLPSEKMLLANDTTKKEFYQKHTENRNMVYSKESNKTKNKGPIILCCDESGSMDGDGEIWSKAFTMGVIEIAQIQRRDFAFIAYASNANDPIVIKKGEISPEKVITICEEFIDGGTHFEKPLNKALELIKDSTFRQADILFVTDGDCSVSEDFKKRFKKIKEEKEFSCKGILIDMGRYRSSSKTLEEFCDGEIVRVSTIADLTDANADVNRQLFSSI